ncbi:adenylate kinase [Nitratiruptor tergarcus]|uniref:Adenylate kinase n=1 Tax=Nitratiruptor tergarcus DSM 16512 TaxID=1069081 RepID=A0A1W1WTN2_9BACT|nr:adenylate kinase [Nitratiruptor tergarcus]SMC09545.1 adenylate kinase [Nitratiruptor tergarcus DSM 16512]
MKKLFLIIGAPGSGKTTDAELVAKRNSDKIIHYSTGELLRAEIAKGTPLGATIASYVDNGKLVPLEIVMDTIKNAILSSDKDIIIIDGFPRSVEQMEALDAMLTQSPDITLKAVIEIVVSEETARERVLGRARGADDNVEVFNNRMKVYLEPLPEIEKFYESKGLLKKIDGERTIEEIVEELEKFILEKANS